MKAGDHTQKVMIFPQYDLGIGKQAKSLKATLSGNAANVTLWTFQTSRAALLGGSTAIQWVYNKVPCAIINTPVRIAVSDNPNIGESWAMAYVIDGLDCTHRLTQGKAR